MKNNILYYSVGALLYCPANKKSIADSVINEKLGNKYSLALCLEDTINDNFVAQAEIDLVESINRIYRTYQDHPFYLPKLFIRVRNSLQISRITAALKDSVQIVTGFIIPKFSTENAHEYINEIVKVNESCSKKMYMMPIYESSTIIDMRYRTDILYELKDILSPVEELVVNIRVGGNDLCHIFGFRRHVNESIHRIKPISNIFSDIITVYGPDYVVSGPVWEYYSGEGWDTGLQKEIEDDKLCGFIGKTVIHPNQIPIINASYQISQDDFNDAQAILNWNHNSNEYVSGSESRSRMNEYKTHVNWAEKTLLMAQAFGIKH